MTTIVSFIPEEDHVITARQALARAGIPEEKIKILSQPLEVWRRLHGRRKIRALLKNVAVGALLGAVLGLMAAIPAGYFNCAKEACTVPESLWQGAIITAVFAAAGGFLAAMGSIDRFENDVLLYVDGVMRGEPLFMIDAPEDTAEKARRILTEEHGLLIYEES
jgi:hypothetical protein